MSTQFGSRLKQARIYAGLTQIELSKKAGVRQSTISDAERVASGSAHTAQFASICGVDAHWLATGEGDMKPSNTTSNVKFSGVAPIDLAMAMVPLISSVRAGTWGEINDHHPDSNEKFPVREAKTGPHAFALRVEGDSMTCDSVPTFPEGTVLIVDPGRAAKTGDYVVAKDVATQRATFKKLTTDGSRWYLKPLNRDYTPIEIDDPAIRVIGVVVEYWSGGKL